MSKSSAQQKLGPDQLDTMFPTGRTVKLASGQEVTVKPLPLRQLPRFMKVFARIASLAEGGLRMGDIIEEAGDDVLDIIDVCLDASIDELSASDGPDVLEAFIDLNVTDEIVGKWRGLLQRASRLMPEAPQQSQSGS